MCFQWMRKIYQYLQGRCGRRNRGYSNDISSHHRGYHSGGLSNIEGRGSFFCGGEGSIIYSRGASSSQPMPAPSSYNIEGRYTCGGDGSVVITSGDSGGTSGWGTTGETVPVYGPRGEIGSSGGIAARRGSVYGYDAPPRERALTAGVGSGGPGYYSGGTGYDIGEYSGPEFSSVGDGSYQATQQKCPVVIPNIEDQQCKKGSHWPPSQKK